MTKEITGWEEEFREAFVGGFDAIREDSPYLPQILDFIRDTVASAVEAERSRISDEIIKAIGASKLGILKNKTTLEVLKDILSIINPSKE